MPFELQTLVRLGVSPQNALLAGTRWGAEACRIDRTPERSSPASGLT